MTSTRTLLFTDIVDSTQLSQQLGDERMARLWAEHDSAARDLLSVHGGIEVDRADGFFLLFDDAAAALHFALAYHEAMAVLGLRARAGLHTGPVRLRENAAAEQARGAKRLEVDGLAKPLAARVMALADGGRTLLSADCRVALAHRLPAGTLLHEHGHYRLKGLAEPIEVLEVGRPDAGAFAPPRDTDKAYRVVQQGGAWLPVRQVRHNLPAERDVFIGREAELRSLAQRLESGVRLVTALGPGGTGKTRLVRHYARDWLGDWPGGVAFCDLSDTSSLDGICYAVATALEVPLGKDEPVLQLGHAIAGRGRCLVILDNFEQVAEHAEATVGAWLDRAADAVFVVTSRERLSVPGEFIFAVEPLSLGREAVELFEARAQAQLPGFSVRPDNRGAVEEVVRLLDGLPLAIELAAARVRVLSPAQLELRLRDRFQLLALGSRAGVSRQATLRAAIDWSWVLLDSPEQAALAQCSVFEGGFTLEAAERVIDLSLWPHAAPVLDTVQSLVDKSLLRVWRTDEQGRLGIGEPYFGMYVSVREFAAEKCRSLGLQEGAEQRHADFFAAFGHADVLAMLDSPGTSLSRRALTQELDNLVAACRRSVARGAASQAAGAYGAMAAVLDLRGPIAAAIAIGRQVVALPTLTSAERIAVCNVLTRALHRSGRSAEALSWAEQAVALALATPVPGEAGRALLHLGWVHRGNGRMAEAGERIRAALEAYRAEGNSRGEATTLAALGQWLYEQGRIDEALATYEQALAMQRELHDRIEEASLLMQLGGLHAEQGRLDIGREHFERSVALAADVGDRMRHASATTNLGCLHLEQGRLDDAAACFESSLVGHREVGNRRYEGYVLGDTGRLELQRGNLAAARDCLEQSLAITRETGDRRIEGSELRSLGDVSLALGRLDEAAGRFAEAEAVLRAVGDRFYLGYAVSGRGEVERRQGRVDAARASCDEARLLAEQTRSGPESELGRRVAALEAALLGSQTA